MCHGVPCTALQGPLAPNARLRSAVRLFDGLIKGSGEFVDCTASKHLQRCQSHVSGGLSWSLLLGPGLDLVPVAWARPGPGPRQPLALTACCTLSTPCQRAAQWSFQGPLLALACFAVTTRKQAVTPQTLQLLLLLLAP